MNNRSAIVGVVLVALFVVGLSCRWEEWDHKDTAGASVFRYRSVLLPWQDAQAPPAGMKVNTVTMQRRSYFGLNRFDYTGPPGALTPQPGQSAPR